MSGKVAHAWKRARDSRVTPHIPVDVAQITAEFRFQINHAAARHPQSRRALTAPSISAAANRMADVVPLPAAFVMPQVGRSPLNTFDAVPQLEVSKGGKQPKAAHSRGSSCSLFRGN